VELNITVYTGRMTALILIVKRKLF
jgi:hypothetical protein